MSVKTIHPAVKAALEFGPVLLFFVAYVLLKDEVFDIGGTQYSGFIIVTAAFVPLLLASTALMWFLTGELSSMQILTAVLVTVFGGLSVWLNDERFFKMKPTLIYILLSGILGFGLLRGKSYLAVALGAALPLKPEGWMILTKRVSLFFLILAASNEAVWRLMSTEAWVHFKTFGLTAAVFLFFLTQGGLLERYKEDDKIFLALLRNLNF